MLKLCLVLIFISSSTCQWYKCEPCYCMYYNEIMTANCARTQTNKLKGLPTFLRPEVQDLNLTNQHLETLPEQSFVKLGLLQLKYLILVNCKISTVHETAFANLTKLFEINLSYNKITNLSDNVFKSNLNLQGIYLQGNQIQTISRELFQNLTSLLWLDLQSNQIKHLDYLAFLGQPRLRRLKLNDNQLRYLNVSTVQRLDLQVLTLGNNPWICNCRFRRFHDWYRRFPYFEDPEPKCSLPKALEDVALSEADSDEFPCWLHIEYPSSRLQIIANSDKVTLPCLINSSPGPRVKWVFNNLTLNQSESRYSLNISQVQHVQYWYNLTIDGLTYNDIGVYECVAKNFANKGRIAIEVANNTGDVFKFLLLTVVVCCVFIISILTICVKCFIRYHVVSSMRREYNQNT